MCGANGCEDCIFPIHFTILHGIAWLDGYRKMDTPRRTQCWEYEMLGYIQSINGRWVVWDVASRMKEIQSFNTAELCYFACAVIAF